MTNFSEIVVFILMVPVLMQIVLPLLMLAGYGMGRMVKVLLGKRSTDAVALDSPRSVPQNWLCHI